MAVCRIAGVRLPNGQKASLGRVLAMDSQDQCKAIRLSPKFKAKVVMESMEYLRKNEPKRRGGYYPMEDVLSLSYMTPKSMCAPDEDPAKQLVE